MEKNKWVNEQDIMERIDRTDMQIDDSWRELERREVKRRTAAYCYMKGNVETVELIIISIIVVFRQNDISVIKSTCYLHLWQ